MEAPAPFVVISAALSSVHQQLSALLQVVSQVAQTSIIDLSCQLDLPLQYQALETKERLALDWLIEQVVLANQLILIPDILYLPKVVSLLELSPTELEASQVFRFYAGFPIKNEEQVVGVLSVIARQPYSLTQEQQNAIATLAEQISYLLTAKLPHAASLTTESPTHAVPKTARLEAAFSSSPSFWNQGHAAVMKISMALQQCLSFEDLNNQLITVLPKVLPVTAFELMLFQGAHSPRKVCLWPSEANVPTCNEEQLKRQHLTPSARYNNPQISPAKGIRITPPAKDHSASTNGQDTIWYCYPFKIKQRTIGTFTVELALSENHLTLEDHDILNSIAEQIGVTIHRLQLLQKLQSENLQDPLTKLFNRRYMMSVLSKLLKRVSYGHYQVGLIMMDIDHFKQLNDTFGHDAGDQVLRVLGLFLKGHARPNDAICRYGGEEFALILSDLTWDVLERRANQLCRSVKYLSLKAGDKPLSITLSAGFAIAPLHAKTPSTLIKAADEALYIAKRAGRDRAVGAPFPESDS